MKIVGLGDSITFGYGVPREKGWFDRMKNHFPKYVWDNCGIPGDSSTGMLRRFLFDVEVKRPKYLTILGGANDLMEGALPQAVVNNLIKIGEQAQEKNIIPLFLLPFTISLKPDPLGWLSEGEAREMHDQIIELREQISVKTAEKNWFCFDTMSVLSSPDEMEAYFLVDGVHVNAKMHEMIAEGLTVNNPFV